MTDMRLDFNAGQVNVTIQELIELKANIDNLITQAINNKRTFLKSHLEQAENQVVLMKAAQQELECLNTHQESS